MDKKIFTRLLLVVGIVGLFAYFAFPLNKRINLGLDLQGGMHLLLKVDTSKVAANDQMSVTDITIEKLRNRIDDLGVSEPTIQRHGIDEIVVQLPGVTDRERAINKIGQTGLLEFKLVASEPDKLKEALAGNVTDGYELKYAKEDKEPLLLEKTAVLSGDGIKDASTRFDQSQFNEPVVGLEFNPEAAKKFAEITAANVGRRLAIVLDGKVQSAPNIREAIPSGEAVITGRFDYDEAVDLAKVLKHGALPAKVTIQEERTVGPLLGKDSIDKGVKSSIIGFALVFIFMVFYYLLAGFVANIALFCNMVMILGGLGMLPYFFGASAATLTLPGIAGMILSLGMAVDANVLINERIREELSAGKSLRNSIDQGYAKAFSAIFDSNITTLVAAVILIFLGTGSIKGFGVTLTIGLIASMFTAIVVTRVVFEILIGLGVIKSKLVMLQLIKTPNFDYIGKRKIFYFISIVVIGVGLFSFLSKGKQAYGIDFSGGQLQEYSFKTAPDMDKVRGLLKELKMSDASLQQFKESPNVLLIRTNEDNSQLLTDKLKVVFADQDVQVLRIERVGPIAGEHLKKKAWYALFWALVGILIYVAFRFKHFNFAAAGVIALIHDVLVALGFLAMTGRQIDLLSITAFLTIAGYSINDTIVIYDRVRENSRIHRKKTLTELINLSVNQTMSRTLLTSGVTLLVVLAIYFYGGEVLSNFAFTLLVGFISGVYSTVFIASPLVLAWQGKKAKV